MSEQVLVTHLQGLPVGSWYNTGVPIFNTHFIPKERAECDFSRKQIIPYVMLFKGDKLVSYRRSKNSGENRLHNKLSLGFGGHINEDDKNNVFRWLRQVMPSLDFQSALNHLCETCVKRELQEELGINAQTTDYTRLTCLGTINDDSNLVGKVHIGIVYTIRLPDYQVLTYSPEIEDVQYHSLDELRNLTDAQIDEFESWSKLALSLYLDNYATKPTNE